VIGMEPRGAKAIEVLGYGSTVRWFAKFAITRAEVLDISDEELAIMFPQGLVAGLSRAGCALLERKRRRETFRLVRGGKR
jgi:hypothetical protein